MRITFLSFSGIFFLSISRVSSAPGRTLNHAYKAIAERFRAFLAEQGRDDENRRELFKEINLSLSKAMDAAFDRANDRLKERFEEIAEDYNFSDEDKKLVGSAMSDIMKDVNANLLSSFAGNKMENFDPESALK